jgi:hypothetical protein
MSLTLHKFCFQLHKSCGFKLLFKEYKSILLHYNANLFCGSMLDSHPQGHGMKSLSSEHNCLSFVQPPCYLHYTKNYYIKVSYSPKIKKNHCLAIQQVALMPTASLVCSSAKLVLPIGGSWKYDFRVDSNDITSTPNFIQICPLVLKLNHASRQTDSQTNRQDDPYMHSLHAHCARNT